MRTISAAAVAELAKTSDIEPVILVKIYWNGGNGITYSDRKFEPFGFQGKILSVGPIDDVINIQGSSSSAQVSILLDDSDGTLKAIFNTSDIHKTRVQLLQWFSNLPVSEAFVVFDGQINSPIEWKESDRTLSFEAVTAIENLEVGISIEELTFNLMPESLLGRAWPVVFGTAGGVPALLIQETPSAVIARGVGVVNEPVWDFELAELAAAVDAALNNWRLMFQVGVGTAIIASGYKSDFPPFHYKDLDRADALDAAAQDCFNQAAAFYAEALTIQDQIRVKNIEYDKQQSFSPAAFEIVTNNLPAGTTLTFKAGDMTLIGVYNGQYFFITDKQFPREKNVKGKFNQFTNSLVAGNISSSLGYPLSQAFEVNNSGLPGGSKFYWLEGGTQLRATNFPLNYIASIGHVNVLRVYAYQNGVRTIVPNYYYSVVHTTYANSGGLPLLVTYIHMDVPLTSRVIQDNNAKKDITWDSDEIEVDCSGGIGPNAVDIMIWAITNFTSFNYDATSFNAIRTKLQAYPCNFVLMERISCTQFLEELAFQVRCAIWLNDNTFYLRYLSERPTAVDTITDDDILVESLSVTCTPTEDLVTKLTARWRARYNQQKDNLIIYKYNTLKYGTFPLEYNFYAFSVRELVAKSAEFWIIRKSNTFKIIKFKTTIAKLRLENFDPVTIDLENGMVANGPVLGIVQKAVYNSDDNTIDFEVWVPVRLGEMEEYPFAHPAGLDVTYRYPVQNDPNLATGNPYEAIQGSLPDPQTFQAGTFNLYVNRDPTILDPPVYGRDEPVGDAGDEAPTENPQVPTSGTIVSPGTAVGAGGYSVNDYGKINGNDPLEDANKYTKYTVNNPKEVVIPDPVPATFPGQIVSGTDGDYQVKIYTRGLNGGTTTVPVKQLKVRTGETIPPDTWVEVHRHVWKVERQLQVEYTMQSPIWLRRITS